MNTAPPEPPPAPASATADAFRLAIGTFTRLPTRAPSVVDRRRGGLSLLLAPAVGLLLGCLAAFAGLLLWWIAGAAGNASTPIAFVAAAVTLATASWLSRGLHLDGLADLADGLGSVPGPATADGERMTAAMRDPQIGAFGAIALIFTIGVQLTALASCFATGLGASAFVAAAISSRSTLVLVARRGTPSRASGLGAAVVGVVPTTVGVLEWSVIAGLISVLLWSAGAAWFAGPIAASLALAAALVVRRIALQRLTVVTGDVLGACVEGATTVFLVLLAVLA
ncbi:MAG: adenosylcobinamide-GDP ribazoletransferase [Actinomycetota bacterium]|nr:adenosylcobinamide-GDP ribazoletransferase [Actinomycetota bacterium]